MDRRRFLSLSVATGSLLALPVALSRQAFAASLPSAITDFSALDLSTAIRAR